MCVCVFNKHYIYIIFIFISSPCSILFQPICMRKVTSWTIFIQKTKQKTVTVKVCGGNKWYGSLVGSSTRAGKYLYEYIPPNLWCHLTPGIDLQSHYHDLISSNLSYCHVMSWLTYDVNITWPEVMSEGACDVTSIGELSFLPYLQY